MESRAKGPTWETNRPLAGHIIQKTQFGELRSGGLALEGGLGLSMTTKQGPSGGETQAPHAEMESVILAEET